MARHHGVAHAHHMREAKREPKTDLATVYSVQYITLSQTFSGAADYSTQSVNTGAIAFTRSSDSDATTTKNSNSKTTSSAADDKTSSTPTSAAAQSTSEVTSATSSAEPTSTTPAVSSSASSAAQSSSLASSSAASSRASATQASLTAGAAAATSSAAVVEHSTSSGGMSGGAKAGLAIGLLLAIGLIFGAAFLLYRRKKQQQDGDGYNQHVDDEKHAMSGGAPGATGAAGAHMSTATTRSSERAPRLSLRPVTQFLPNLGPNRKSGGNLLDVVAEGGAAGAASRGHQAPVPQQATSPWERRIGQNNANDPANPFGNHAEVTDEKAAVNNQPSGTVNSRNVTNGRPLTPPSAADDAEHDQREPYTPKPLSVKSGKSDASFTTASSMPEIGTASTASAVINPAAAAAVTAAGLAGSARNSGETKALGAGSPKPAPPPNNVYQVKQEYVPNMDDELPLRIGEYVRMLHEYDDGWALCIRMDRSKQGVVPRSCLGPEPVKPKPRPVNTRPQPQGQGRPRGDSGALPGGRPPMGPGSAPQSPRRPASPGPFATPPRSPRGNSPLPSQPMSTGPRVGPFPAQPRPMSPYQASRARSRSNASNQAPPRSMSPGPMPRNAPAEARRRSKSVGNVRANQSMVPSPLSPSTPPSKIPVRKPVPGQ